MTRVCFANPLLTHSALSMSSLPMSLSEQFQKDGFAVVPDCLSAEIVARLILLTENARVRTTAPESVANSSGVYALRNLVDAVPEVAELISNPDVVRLVSAILGSDAFMVRSTLFDKTNGANWGSFGIRICRSQSRIGMRLKATMPGRAKLECSACSHRSASCPGSLRSDCIWMTVSLITERSRSCRELTDRLNSRQTVLKKCPHLFRKSSVKSRQVELY